MRHVKGSHIVVPRVHPEEHAYILQNADKRIVFVIPYQDHYSLIGTTDIPVDEYEHPAISEDEIDYLLELVNSYLGEAADPRRRRVDLQRRAAAVRRRVQPIPSAVTRDYVFKVDALDGEPGPEPRAGAVDLRRQDHDLPQAGRSMRSRSWRRTFPA